jgi:DNA-binding beta-propeller fold protein YncE
VALAAGRLWVTNCYDATVIPVDPRTNRVAGAPIVVGRPAAPADLDALQHGEQPRFSCPLSISPGDGAVWVALVGDEAVVPVAFR